MLSESYDNWSVGHNMRTKMRLSCLLWLAFNFLTFTQSNDKVISQKKREQSISLCWTVILTCNTEQFVFISAVCVQLQASSPALNFLYLYVDTQRSFTLSVPEQNSSFELFTLTRFSGPSFWSLSLSQCLSLFSALFSVLFSIMVYLWK